MVMFTFLFWDGNNTFRQIGSKKSKLLVKGEILYLDEFDHAEFTADVHFFCFQLKITLFGQLWSKR